MTNTYQNGAEEILILACGNPLRGDDGAGLALASALDAFLHAAGCGTRLRCVQQLAPELALDIARETVAAVLFVDARAAIDSSASTLRIAIEPIDLTDVAPSFTHHVGPRTLLLYARELYHRAPPAWLITIPGTAFDHGTEFSPVVRTLLADVDSVGDQVLSHVLRTVN